MVNTIKNFFKKNKKLIYYIIVTLLIGFAGSLLGDNTDIYSKINTPAFAPPGILFPIVWSILYILMAISVYLVSKEDRGKKNIIIYFVQLIVNALWSLFFFKLNWFLFSTVWIALLILLVSVMVFKFGKVNKTAAYLQIPYIAWISFAFILNLSIYLLNK